MANSERAEEPSGKPQEAYVYQEGEGGNGLKRRRDSEDDGSASSRPRKTVNETVGRQIYVGNLDFRTTKRYIEEEFGRFGLVEDIFLPVDDRRQPRGFCFVTFAEARQAEEACEELNNREFDGRVIRVNIARPRPPPNMMRRDYDRRDADRRDHRRDDRQRRPPPGRVFVSGLPEDINEREIDDLYYKYGRIDYIEVRRGSRSGRVEAVVSFEDVRDAEAAARDTDGMRFERDYLRVDLDDRR
ncbi:hypothetical protein CTAYLR_008601 [Chrysophaeum taylorii]|uniref:RRM domain-containing protein n=1 Tax=Chrysophaeum taylorii TaxID=2483200 RepID=A0AAD7UI69_9STRA|nr:hypothetical protein CTAYLR_008601 [Chrysophaeum taylorii]